MSPKKRLDDWIDEDEYPDDEDVEDFGEQSPFDYDPLSVGKFGGNNPHFWTRGRIALAVVVLLIVAALLLPSLLTLAR